MSSDICIKLTKKWGGFKAGDVVRFGLNKGLARIKAGDGVKVKTQRALNDPPVVETAVHSPRAETAMLDNKAKSDAKAEAKARAEAKAETEEKAKSEAEAKSDAKEPAEAGPLTEGKSRSRFGKRK